MISRKLKNGNYMGYSDDMKNIIISPQNNDLLSLSSFYQVKITGAEAFKLYGTIV